VNKLSEEQKNEIINQYDIDSEMLDLIEDVFRNLKIEDFEYYYLVIEVASEYQTYKFNKELDSSLAESYNNLRDVIVKVLKYKLKSSSIENSNYENELNSLILKLTKE